MNSCIADKSTTTSAIDLLGHIYGRIGQGNIVSGVFLDLTKQRHKVLLSQLENCGVRGVVLYPFKHYLSNRKQFLHVMNTKSAVKSVSRGIPQSCLAPLLFLIFLSDLDTYMSVRTCLLMMLYYFTIQNISRWMLIWLSSNEKMSRILVERVLAFFIDEKVT